MERVRLSPPEQFDVALHVPGSKSFTNRALVSAALASGPSTLRNVSLSDDSNYMIAALRRVGVRVEQEKTSCVVHGRGGAVQECDETFHMGNAGTALRFFTSMACLGKGRYVVDGDERMRERPIQGLVDTLVQLGADVRSTGGCPPVTIRAGGLPGGSAEVDGTVSSQFVSSVLMAAPCAREPVRLSVRGDLASKPYLDMTIGVMQKFAAVVHREGYASFEVPVGRYVAREFEVEGDAASAGYFFSMAAVSKGCARVNGIGRDCAQGEVRIVDLLGQMGCDVEKGDDHIEVRGARFLRGIDVDMNDCPDSVQTISVVALFAEGPTRIRNVANLRVKETDRISALATELQKFGARVEEAEDGLTVHPPTKVGSSEVRTYGDHRMALSFSVLGAVQPVIIRGPECVRKSFPDYFERLKGLGFSLQATA